MVTTNTPALRAVVVGGETLVAERLTALGYEIVARVTAGREALDAARRLTPDAVVFETELSDGLGVLAAQAVTRATPGVAALILSAHPAAAIREARPQWGAVSLLSADAAEDELDSDVREAIARARALAGVETSDIVEVEDVLEPVTETDEELVDRAIAAVAERSGMSPSDAFRLMEQEADDNGQTLRDVALTMLADGES